MRDCTGIVGGGLSGLYAAWLLEQAGEDYLLLEGRARFGGRLLTVSAQARTDGQARAGAFDLGATWYWPAWQPELSRLVGMLGLEAFRQPDDGDVILEGRTAGRTMRIQGDAGAPASMRIQGGMGALVDALASRLRPDRLLVAHRVRALKIEGGRVAIESVDGADRAVRHEVARVLLAIPPRLARATIGFEPALPSEIASDWGDAATWMAPHAKYLAVYPRPFWRDRGLSGGGRSQSGPLVEIHDASSPGGPAAVFGFVGVPAATRREVPDEALRAMCRAQLVRLFGEEAANPDQEWLQDWSREPCTATDADLLASNHPERAAGQVHEAPWRGRLVGIASEWSPAFPGYIAGAVEAAAAGVAAAFAPTAEKGACR